MVYKQNIGVLSLNQNILKKAYTIFSVDESSTDNYIRYNLSKCNGFYLLSLNIEGISTLRITPSTSCYDITFNVNQEYVYKEDGSIVVNLNQISLNRIFIKIKINKKESLLLSCRGNINGNKVVYL